MAALLSLLSYGIGKLQSSQAPTVKQEQDQDEIVRVQDVYAKASPDSNEGPINLDSERVTRMASFFEGMTASEIDLYQDLMISQCKAQELRWREESRKQEKQILERYLEGGH